MSKDLVTLVTPPTEFEANILAIVLRDNGIDAFVFATPTVGIGIGLSAGRQGVPLQVQSDDVELAREILLENKRHSIDIDWDEFESFGKDNTSYVDQDVLHSVVNLAFGLPSRMRTIPFTEMTSSRRNEAPISMTSGVVSSASNTTCVRPYLSRKSIKTSPLPWSR